MLFCDSSIEDYGTRLYVVSRGQSPPESLDLILWIP